MTEVTRKFIYSKPNCPSCITLKFRMDRLKEPYEEIVVGKDITLEEFIDTFPDAKTFPYVVSRPL